MSDITLSANAQKIMDLTEGLTILELADLVSAMEEKFGVSAAAPVAMMGAQAGSGAEEAEEKSTYNVVLTSAGAAKIAVIKVLRDLTGLGLAEAKAIADNGGNVKEGISKADADNMKKSLEEAGATVELK